MKKFRITALLVVMILICNILTAVPCSAVKFSNNKGEAVVIWNDTETVFTAEKYQGRFSKALRFALEYAGQVATKGKPAVVKMTAGNYLFDNHLYIYSNTTLDATGSYVKFPDSSILSNKYNNGATSVKGYKGSENMTVIGGIWDVCGKYAYADKIEPEYITSTFRFAHCRNVTFSNCTFKNNYSGHDIEAGGVKNLKVLDCTFKNDKSVNKYEIVGGKEAIQLDINTKVAMSSFPAFDSTASRDVTVKGCTFKNKFRGVGSHHGTIGKPFENINICNNTFENINGLAVYLIHTNNAKVYDNKIKACGSGIYVGSVVDSKAIHNTNGYSCGEANKTVKSSESYIYGNTISIRSKQNTIPFIYGIRADGRYLKADDKTTKVKKGTYYVYGVNVGITPEGKASGNKISGNFHSGISLHYAKNANVANNTVKLDSCKKDLCYGIEARSSKSVKISKNTVTNTKRKNALGIMVSDLDSNGISSEKLTIKSNTIDNYYKTKKSSSGNFGIRLYNDATNVDISSNKIKSGNACICASGYGDKIKTAKKYTVKNNKLDTYAEKGQIVFRSVKLSKSIQKNYQSSGKKCVVVIA